MHVSKIMTLVAAGAVITTGLVGCGNKNSSSTYSKSDGFASKKSKSKTPAEKIANAENVITDSKDMLLYAVMGDQKDDGTYDCTITQDGKKIQWTQDLAANMMYLKSGDKVKTGSDMLAKQSIGQSLLENGIESDTEVQFDEYKDGNKFKPVATLQSGGITFAMRRNDKISSYVIKTDDTTVTVNDECVVRVTYQAGKVKTEVIKGAAIIKHGKSEKTETAGKFYEVDESNGKTNEGDIDFSTMSLEGLMQLSSIYLYNLNFDDNLYQKLGDELKTRMDALANS